MGPRMLRLLVVAGLVFGSVAVGSAARGSGAPGNPWQHTIVNGFASATGDGFWLVYADGTVETHGDAGFFGDASDLPLNGPMVGGAVAPDGGGYWLVAQDGGIFSYGSARFFGSMGGAPLNQPVFSMTPTRSGEGYWLVAFDGGIFSFGDAVFYGSTGDLMLNQPMTGITTAPSGRGYQMVARDGGVFAFGDYPFLGSLPGLGISTTDVVGAAQTPTGEGYWVARASGEVYSFGDADDFGDASPPEGDPVAAIFSHPTIQGYWLVLASGTPLEFGDLDKDPFPAGVTRNVAYGTTEEGHSLLLDLYVPDGTAKERSAVVFAHGRGDDKADLQTTSYATDLAADGYVVASINYRQIGPGIPPVQDFIDAQHDMQAAVRWMRAHEPALRIDADRVFVAGHSGGAIAAMFTVFRSDDPGASGNPGYSSDVAGGISLAGFASANDVDPGEPPILMFHGTADNFVPINLARLLCEATVAAGNTCDFIAYEGLGHRFESRHDDTVADMAAFIDGN